MSESRLSINVSEFVKLLANIFPSPKSIWVIGSQANGRATENSDTDILVFASEEFYRFVKEKISPPNNIDCLIVKDGNNYQDPWKEKSGSIQELKWQKVTETTARYIGRKWVSDEESSVEYEANFGVFVELNENAFRVWP